MSRISFFVLARYLRFGITVGLLAVLLEVFSHFSPARGCPIVLPLGPAMQSPVSSSDKMIRSLSLFMIKGMSNQSSAAVAEEPQNWRIDCNAFPTDLLEPLTTITGAGGFLDWRLLRDLFETHFLNTVGHRRQHGIIKEQVTEMHLATGFASWDSRIVAYSAVKRKSRRIFRSPESFTPKVSVSQTLDSEDGNPSASILETEVAVQRHLGRDWDFYSYNQEGALVNFSTFPAGEGPSPRTCLNCHYNSTSRVFNRFLP